jgi:hypothetical protein
MDIGVLITVPNETTDRKRWIVELHPDYRKRKTNVEQ